MQKSLLRQSMFQGGKLLEQNLSMLFTSRARFTILVHFHGFEDQMCERVPGVEKSPDRLDALVWAVTKLTEGSFNLGQFDLSKLIRTMPRNSFNINCRTSAFYC